MHDLGGIYVSYISYIPFETIDDGYTTECRLGMTFFTWCIVKLVCYVTLCSACHILDVDKYISHLGIKMIYWSWVVGDVTKTPEFSDHIQVNCLFFTREKYFALKTTPYSKSAFIVIGSNLLTSCLLLCLRCLLVTVTCNSRPVNMGDRIGGVVWC